MCGHISGSSSKNNLREEIKAISSIRSLKSFNVHIIVFGLKGCLENLLDLCSFVLIIDHGVEGCVKPKSQTMQSPFSCH